MIRLADDRPIAMTLAALRIIVRVVLAQGEERGLLAFGMADNHLHALLAASRALAGAFARYVESALVWQLGLTARFERARILPIHDQSHAYNTFRYIHRQDSRHGLHLDPAREGTSLLDLLRARVLDTSLIARVRIHLPRIQREDLVAQFPPAAFDGEAPIELNLLRRAAEAALAVADVRGRSIDALRARRAAVHAAGPSVPSDRLSDSLGIGVRAIQSLRAQPGEPAVIRAVVQQARLHSVVKNLSCPDWLEDGRR